VRGELKKRAFFQIWGPKNPPSTAGGLEIVWKEFGSKNRATLGKMRGRAVREAKKGRFARGKPLERIRETRKSSGKRGFFDFRKKESENIISGTIESRCQDEKRYIYEI
jgi:hypothetical protein